MTGLGNLSASGEEIPFPVYRFPGISQSRRVQSSGCIFSWLRFSAATDFGFWRHHAICRRRVCGAPPSRCLAHGGSQCLTEYRAAMINGDKWRGQVTGHGDGVTVILHMNIRIRGAVLLGAERQVFVFTRVSPLGILPAEVQEFVIAQRVGRDSCNLDCAPGGAGASHALAFGMCPTRETRHAVTCRFTVSGVSLIAHSTISQSLCVATP